MIHYYSDEEIDEMFKELGVERKDIDEDCIDLVVFFNSIGLKTKFCCSGHGKEDFSIMFDDQVYGDKLLSFIALTTPWQLAHQHMKLPCFEFQRWDRFDTNKDDELRYRSNWIFYVSNVRQTAIQDSHLIFEWFQLILKCATKYPNDIFVDEVETFMTNYKMPLNDDSSETGNVTFVIDLMIQHFKEYSKMFSTSIDSPFWKMVGRM